MMTISKADRKRLDPADPAATAAALRGALRRDEDSEPLAREATATLVAAYLDGRCPAEDAHFAAGEWVRWIPSDDPVEDLVSALVDALDCDNVDDARKALDALGGLDALRLSHQDAWALWLADGQARLGLARTDCDEDGVAAGSRLSHQRGEVRLPSWVEDAEGLLHVDAVTRAVEALSDCRAINEGSDIDPEETIDACRDAIEAIEAAVDDPEQWEVLDALRVSCREEIPHLQEWVAQIAEQAAEEDAYWEERRAFLASEGDEE